MSPTIATPTITPSPSSVSIPVVIDYNLTQITPFVFVTAEYTARQAQQIFSNGIGCVINVANELPQIVFPSNSGVESLKYPIQDNPTFPAAQYFDSVADRVAVNAAQNRRTLLYCSHGRSRSITFILAYLIKHHRIPLPLAFAHVKQRRQLALPNTGFWSQLQTYEMQQQRSIQGPSYFVGNNYVLNKNFFGKISDGMQHILAEDPMLKLLTNAVPTVHRHQRVRRLVPYYYPISMYQRRFTPMNPYFLRAPMRTGYRR